ncbi:MAG TPA: DUF2304 domain-containing protein [Nitrospirota bacterium]|jgi:hypothetical protein
MDKVQIVSVVISLAILLGVFELVRNGRLREAYSVLWICTAIVMICISVFHQIIDKFGAMAGIGSSATVLFLLAFIFLILINIQFSLIISVLTERNKLLMQEMAILGQRIEELENKTELS